MSATTVVSFEWFDGSNWISYEPEVSKRVEAAFKAKKDRVNVDDERFIELKSMTQLRFDNKFKKRSVRRVETLASLAPPVGTPSTPPPSKKKTRKRGDDDDDDDDDGGAGGDDDDSTDDDGVDALPRLRCFEKEVFHLVARDRDLEKSILAHGGELAKSMHRGVTRIVGDAFKDDMFGAALVSARDVRNALRDGGFRDAKRRRSLPGARDKATRTSKAAAAATTTTTTTTTTTATATTTATTSSAMAMASSTALSSDVRAFVDWIGEVKDFDDAMKRFEIDVSRVLLGTLSRAQLLKGFATLRKIETVLSKKYNAAELTSLSRCVCVCLCVCVCFVFVI